MQPIHTANATTVLSIAALGRSVQRQLDSQERNDVVALERARAVHKASECLLRRRYRIEYSTQIGR